VLIKKIKKSFSQARKKKKKKKRKRKKNKQTYIQQISGYIAFQHTARVYLFPKFIQDFGEFDKSCCLSDFLSSSIVITFRVQNLLNFVVLVSI